MVAIDLFAGAGGMSSGAKLAGIDVKLAVQRDPYAANTFHSSSPSSMDRFAAIPDHSEDNYHDDEV